MPAPLTLEKLRQYASEVSSADVAGATADREIQGWINKALQRIYRAHQWNWTHTSGAVFLEVEESGSALNVTQYSKLLTLTSGQSETFDPKYLTESWHLHVDTDGNRTFEISDISDPLTATLKEGHQWTGDTATDTDYAWSRHIYPLPDSAKQVVRVELMQNRLPLRHLTPGSFDRARQSTPTQRGGDPLYYTFRKHRLEIWPAPGTIGKTLLVTYRRGPTTYESHAPGSTVVDWAPDWDDLLLKAITLEASITQGQNAVVPYGIALKEYEDCLDDYREDDGVQDLTGPMELTMGPNYYDRGAHAYQSPIPENG